jgi:hypothetical protein
MQLALGQKRKHVSQKDHSENKKKKKPSSFKLSLVETLNCWPMDLIDLLLDYIFLPCYKNACLEKEKYDAINLGNDLYYHNIYKLITHNTLSCNNYCVEIPFLDFYSSVWIRFGKIFIDERKPNGLRIYDVIHCDEDKEKNDLTSQNKVSPFQLFPFEDFFFLSFYNLGIKFDCSVFKNIDCDSHYIYIQTDDDIWLFPLEETQEEEEFMYLEAEPLQDNMIAVNHDDEFFYIHVSWREHFRENEIWVCDKKNPSPLTAKVKLCTYEGDEKVFGFYVFHDFLYIIYQKTICIVSLPIIQTFNVFQTLDIGSGILLNTFDTYDDINTIYFTGEAACVKNQLYVGVGNKDKYEQICILSL